MFKRRLLPIGCLAAFVVCAGGPGIKADQPAAGNGLAGLLAEAWDFEMRWDPLWATHTGDHRFDDRLPERGLAAEERWLKAKRGFQERLASIDRKTLDDKQRLDYDVFGVLLANDLAEHRFKTYLVPITNRSGFHISFAELPQQVPLATVEDYEHYIARLKGFDTYAEQNIELMREGIKRGITLPEVALHGYRKPIESQIVDDPTRSDLYKPLTKLPDSIGEEDRDRLAKAARKAVQSSVVPGYRRLLAFMADEYLPHARGSIGASALPDGREFYRHRVRMFTTLDLTPEQVHQRGVEEVERIDGELRALMHEVGFKGDFAAFVEELRKNEKFYARTPEELLKDVAYVMKRIDGELPKLFRKLPSTPCGLREIPAFIAPQTTTAYYMQPAGDGTRPGYYYVNTYDLKSRPLYEIEALTLHEAIPGHHLQLALQQEMQGLPQFRRFADFTAFIEGWGLYAERLGLELGLYQDPYSNVGRLSYEAWRACRLVVDTGMHYLGWSRQEAIDYMAEHTALSMHNIRSEVDRYITWPGQALAYKVGELKIRELRKQGERRLGKRFDVREFHEVLLESGALPLSVVEDRIEAWIGDKEDVKRKSGEGSP